MKLSVKPLILLFIGQLMLLAWISPFIDGRTDVEVISELPGSFPLAEEIQFPQSYNPTKSIKSWITIPDQWIIPSHSISELKRDGIVIESEKELPELGISVIKVGYDEFNLGNYQGVSQDRTIQLDPFLSAKAGISNGYSFDTTIDWVGAEDLQDKGILGTEIRVAILDSGINSHPLVNPVVFNHSYVENDSRVDDPVGHGTAVASIVSKVAPEAELYNFRCFDAEGQSTLSWILEALNDVLTMNGTIDIVQMSFGGYGIIDELNTAMEQLISVGLIPVVAAGNDGPYGQSITHPAHSPSTIAVGATAEPDEVIPFSSQGPRLYGLAGPDLIAPGFMVEVANVSGGTCYQNGTSFAAPFVSGGAALLLSGDESTAVVRNETRFWKLKAALMASAESLDEVPSVLAGTGFVDFPAALEALADDVVVAMAPRSINPSNYFFQLSTNGQNRTFPISIYSDSEYDLSHPDFEDIPGIDISLNYPDKIYTGLNVLNLSLAISDDLRMNKRTYNLDLEISSKRVTLQIHIENRYSGGRILWDLRHDNDTDSSIFSNGYFGANSILAHWLSSLGRSSAAVVSNESDLYNGGYAYRQEEIDQILGTHDLLVISDPESSYSPNEIATIQNWVATNRSLLVMATWDHRTASGTQTGTNQTSLNDLIKNYGIQLTNITVPTNGEDIVLAKTEPPDGSAIDPFSESYNFHFRGVELEVTESASTKVIASYSNRPLAAVHKTSTGGVVVVVGSTLPFSNLAFYLPNGDYNFKFAWELIDWLLDQQRPTAHFTYSTDALAFIGLDTKSKFKVQLLGLQGRSDPLESLGEDFQGTLIESNGHYLQLTFRKKGNGFEASWKPTTSGVGTLYVNIILPGYAPFNGTVQVDVTLNSFPIFPLLLLVLAALGIGLVIYSIRSKRSEEDYTAIPFPRSDDRSIDSSKMEPSPEGMTEAISKSETRCISCNSLLFSGAAFCETCGARQTPKKEIKPGSSCPKCQLPIRLKSASFCEYCGAKIEDDS